MHHGYLPRTPFLECVGRAFFLHTACGHGPESAPSTSYLSFWPFPACYAFNPKGWQMVAGGRRPATREGDHRKGGRKSPPPREGWQSPWRGSVSRYDDRTGL